MVRLWTKEDCRGESLVVHEEGKTGAEAGAKALARIRRLVQRLPWSLGGVEWLRDRAEI